MSSDHTFQLLPDRFFVVTLTRSLNPDGTFASTQYLFVINILTGHTLKLENPCFHDTTNCLVDVLLGYGVRTENGQYIRGLFNTDEIMKSVCEPDRFEDDEYYNAIDRFVREFKPYFEREYPLHHYYLDENNVFGVGYRIEDNELVISDTLNGKAIKIENPKEHEVTYRFTRFLIAKGVCNNDYDFCLALLSRDQLLEKLGQPTTTDEKKLYKKLITFLSKIE